MMRSIQGSLFWRIKAERTHIPSGWNQGFGLGGDGFWGSKRRVILPAPLRARAFPRPRGLAGLLVLATCLLPLLLTCFGVPVILSRQPHGLNVLQSAWIPRACPPHSGTTLLPTSTEEVSTIVKDSLERCPVALGGPIGSKQLSIRASKHLFHSSVGFPCVNAEAGSCAVQLDLSKMHKYISSNTSAFRVTVQPSMHMDDLMDTVHELGMAVPSEYIPIYTGLTVGGMLLTGAHGSSTQRPSGFGHLVKKLTYVDARGEICEEHNVTDWIGSMGLLGIVTEMEIALVESYKLNTTVSNPQLAVASHGLSVLTQDYRCFKVIKEPDIHLPERIARLVLDPAFSRVMWYPNAHSAIIRWHSAVPKITPGDAYHSFFERRPWAAVGGQLALALDQINFTPIPTDWGICLFARHPPPFWYKEATYGTWLGFNQSIVGWSHRLGGSSCKGSQWGCYWQNQVQTLVEFDMDVRLLGDWIREMRALIDTVEGKGCLPSLLGFAMRFGKASESPMDMAYGRDTAFIDMLVAKGIGSLPAHHQSVFDEIEQITFCRYGARPHWGKNTERAFLNPACPTRDKYPQFDRFLAMTEQLDPRGIFRPTFFQKIVDREIRLPYPGCVAAEDCYCAENAHCGPTALYKCVNGRHEKNASVCLQRFGRE